MSNPVAIVVDSTASLPKHVLAELPITLPTSSCGKGNPTVMGNFGGRNPANPPQAIVGR
jgi:hypothetical protein